MRMKSIVYNDDLSSYGERVSSSSFAKPPLEDDESKASLPDNDLTPYHWQNDGRSRFRTSHMNMRRPSGVLTEFIRYC